MATEPGHNRISRVLSRLSRRSNRGSTKDYRKTTRFEHYISPVQFWLDRLVWRINKSNELQNDWLPVFKIASAHLRTLFSSSKKKPRPALALLFTKEAGGMLLLGAILEALSAAATIGSPLVLRRLLLSPDNMLLGWTLFFMTMAATLLGRAKDQACRTHYVWVETTSRVAILEKSMRLSMESRSMYPAEKIINMSSVDAELLANYMLKFHDVWSAPIQIITICVLTVNIMGSTALFGFLVVLIIFVSQGWANKGIISAQRSYVSCNDGRLGTLTELLYGIKGVKVLGYQAVFRQRVKESRDQQVKALTKYHALSFCYFTAMNQAVAGFSAGIAFLAYYLMGHKLSSAIVFPALAYFNMLYLPVSNTSLAINRQCSTWPSFERIKNFLAAEEAELQVESRKGGLVSVSFTDATFTYGHDKKGEDFEYDKVLHVGSLNIAQNELSIVIGPTGSGKSSFLKAILGEMSIETGSHHTYGTLSYISQDPWVFSGSLRDNVVFAANYDPARYHSVLRMCALDEDFGRGFSSAEKIETIIAESGNNLSGGQRARIALARAIYSDSDILLLDDPFSAVDAKTRLLLLQRIRRLKKTVILVTLHTSFVPMCDNVVAFDANTVTWSGTSKEFISSCVYLEKYSTHAGDLTFESLSNAETDSEDANNLSPATTMFSTTMSAPEDVFEDEERSRGAVSLDVLKFYCRCAGGKSIVLLASLIAGLLTVAKTMSSYWLVWWIEDGLGLKGIEYLGGYLALTVSPALIESLLGLVLVVLSVGASKIIHRIAVDNILAAPLSFFHRQPVGRILNRFSSDVMAMDIFIMNSMDGVLVASTSLLSSIVLVVAAAPVTLAVALPYMMVAGWLLLKFSVAAREMQRSASILHSPVLAIISEAMRGMSSIKVYGAEGLIRGKHDRALDSYMSAKFCRNALDTWITFRAEIASAFLVLICAILLVSGKMSSTQGGLALSNATTISNSVYVLAWCMCELQIKMNSIERLKKYYDGIPTEASGDSRRPSAGVIEFRKASVVYDSQRPPALDGVDLKIRKGERVGIIGRTGSGKSTLISALTCLVPLNGGTITMDDVDITNLDVQGLRTAVRTLTQEPLVLKGTIRENLDPIGTHTDAELIEALEKCQLKSLLIDHGGNDPLSRDLQPNSGELSTGQRQLLCAARVLLLKPDVLLVDEAAANVDFSSDEALQNALQELPKKTTIIAIAHRAATLAWMDRIICMENGQVFEDGTPLDLLNCNESYFREVVGREGKIHVAEAMAKSMKK